MFGWLNCVAALAADRVLLIGISSWQDKKIQPLGQGAVADLAMMRHLAQSIWKFDQNSIVALFNEQATKSSVEQQFEELVNSTEPGDRVLIYFSGHGTQVPDTSGDEVDDALDEAFPMYDTVAAQSETYFLDDQIRQYLNRLKGRRVTVIFDTCHSGTATRGGIFETDQQTQSNVRARFSPFPFSIQQLKNAKQRGLQRVAETKSSASNADAPDHVVVWSAAAQDQLSWGDDARGGIFTQSIFKQLTSGNENAGNRDTLSFMALLDGARKAASVFCSGNPMGRPCPTPFTPMLEAPSFLLALDARNDQFSRVKPGKTPAGKSSADALFGSANDEGLGLQILPGPELRHGQELRYRVSSTRSGKLVLLDLREDGDLYQIFPNKVCSQRDSHIRPGETLTLPDKRYGCAFEAEVPEASSSGTISGQAIAILVEESVDLSVMIKANLNLEKIGDGQQYLSRIAQELTKVWFPGSRGLERVNQANAEAAEPAARPLEWRAISIDYRITR